jgi:DNA-binding PadR family transcriptional regulator
MEASAAATDASAKDPHLPRLHRHGDLVVPSAPQDVASANLEEGTLADLTMRYAYGVARFQTTTVAEQLHLSPTLAGEILHQLAIDGLVEELWQSGKAGSQYRITPAGRELATRLFEVCGYVGPAPVRLESYASMLRWQFANSPQVLPEHVTSSLSGMVLSPRSVQMAGLAISSGRSLFVFGPPGNGKSSLGRAVRTALRGDTWIPYCISVGKTVIRVYDEQCHERVEVPNERAGQIDRRWVRIRRPLIVVGGELTLEMLDLIYSSALRYYEAPPHLKANGGVFLVDDFGRERISPDQLLNRFITPMEHQIDYFTLNTGQKLQVPLRHVIIIATNLDPEKVTDPAFLRRMGYRLYLGAPTPEQYAKIFAMYAQKQGATVTPEVILGILERYRAEKRELRCCEPRDLIDRALDICRFHSRQLELTPKVLDLAWGGYFGTSEAAKPEQLA